jgi:hypothetical protein
VKYGKTLPTGEVIPIPRNTLIRYADLAAQHPQQQLKDIVSGTKAGRKPKLQLPYQQRLADWVRQRSELNLTPSVPLFKAKAVRTVSIDAQRVRLLALCVCLPVLVHAMWNTCSALVP